RRFDREAGKADDVEGASRLPENRRRRLANESQPLLDREQADLVRVGADADHQPVAEARRMLDHVEMPVGHRVEGAGEEAGARHRLKALACACSRGKGARTAHCARAASRPVDQLFTIASDSGSVLAPGRDATKRFYKPRRGLNDISVLSMSWSGRSFG